MSCINDNQYVSYRRQSFLWKKIFNIRNSWTQVRQCTGRNQNQGETQLYWLLSDAETTEVIRLQNTMLIIYLLRCSIRKPLRLYSRMSLRMLPLTLRHRDIYAWSPDTVNRNELNESICQMQTEQSTFLIYSNETNTCNISWILSNISSRTI